MIKMMKEKYPGLICIDCVIDYTDYDFTNDYKRLSTYYIGKCDICKEKKIVTETRDYGYPKVKKGLSNET